MVPTIEFGRRGGAAPEYLIGTVLDFAVAPNGFVYVLDRDDGEHTLRQFDVTGRFVRSVGRLGQGPGEFQAPRSIWVDAAGVLYVYSPRQVNRYDSTGKSLGATRLRLGSATATSETLLVDSAGVMWILINVLPRGVAPGPASLDALLQAYQRVLPSGQVLDTVYRPGEQGAPARSRPASLPPFSPKLHAELSPRGYFVHGRSDSYRITLARAQFGLGSTINIQRDHTPVRIDPREFSDWNVPASSRGGGAPAPEGSSTAPRAPGAKPVFNDIRIGLDGSVWVSISSAAQMNPRVADAASLPPSRLARARWPTPVLFDVYLADGTYRGRVRFPATLSGGENLVIRGDTIWIAVTDESGEPVVRRYLVTR